jgi:hypothetical protein
MTFSYMYMTCFDHIHFHYPFSPDPLLLIPFLFPNMFDLICTFYLLMCHSKKKEVENRSLDPLKT